MGSDDKETMTNTLPQPICIGCNRTPDDPDNPMTEYEIHREEMDSSLADIVRREEGTYNPKNGHFLCDGCYIAAGMPSSPTGWKAP